jgi:hypothetical protein
MSDKLYPISELQTRYSLNSRQAVYDRIAALKIKPVSRGKLSSCSLDKLDKLHEWLKQNPGSAIADFPLHPEVIPPEVMPSKQENLSTVVVDKLDNFTETLQLIKIIAKHFNQYDPMAEYKALIFATENQLILPSSKVTELTGVKPHGQNFTRGSFTFIKSGKIGGESGWLINKWSGGNQATP